MNSDHGGNIDTDNMDDIYNDDSDNPHHPFPAAVQCIQCKPISCLNEEIA